MTPKATRNQKLGVIFAKCAPMIPCPPLAQPLVISSKTIWGCTANISSKISLLVYINDPLMQNLVFEWADFQNFPKFEPKLAQI